MMRCLHLLLSITILISCSYVYGQDTTQTPLQQQKLVETSLQEGKMTADTATLSEEIPEEQAQFERSIGIDGLVIDESITKVGRDFYELFYSGWEPPPNASDFTIYIEEKPGRGRITAVEVRINDNSIYEGNLQPRYDFLEGLAEYVQGRCYNFLYNYEQIKQSMGSEDQKGSGIF